VAALASLLAASGAGCGLLAKGSASKPATAGTTAAKPSTPVVGDPEMPRDTSAVRDDESAPIVKLVVFGSVEAPTAVPYLYGYPIYPTGEAARGLLKLRLDNWQGAESEQYEDDSGVVHRKERLTRLGCTIEGIEESKGVFVPISLRCELPAPKDVGGSERPVIADLRAGASAEQLLALDVMNDAFLGDWHLIEGDLKRTGEGFFNTQHGQLAFGFERGKLSSVAYYFDPPEEAWRSAQLWIQP